MNVVILAAGTSRRLRPLTDQVPKTLLTVKRSSILEHILSACANCGLFDVHLVTGHGARYVQAACNAVNVVEPRFRFRFIDCDRYRDMGNVYSLWMARHLLYEPLILINSDVVFDGRLLEGLARAENEGVLLVDDTKRVGDEEMKVVVSDDRQIVRIDKALDPGDADGEYVGMLKLEPAVAEGLTASLEHVVATAPGGYYEDALQHFADNGGVLWKMSTGGLPCMEIDTFEDLERAREHHERWA